MDGRVISAFTRVFRRAMPGHDGACGKFFDYTPATLLTTYRAYARRYPASLIEREATMQTAGAENAPREREWPFDMVREARLKCDAVLILRSANAKDIPRIRTRVRAARRMRTSKCIRPHASRRIAADVGLWKRLHSRRAATLLSMRVRAQHQPAAVRNDHRRNSLVSGLLFTMKTATRACAPQIDACASAANWAT
jgi:hypothetical protein